MKTIIHLFLFLVLISCHQKTKEKKPITHEVQNKAVPDTIATRTTTIPKNEDISLSFHEAITLTKTKSLPQVETTNFDSFIEEGDYENVDVSLFKLESIYPNFYKEGYNYKALTKYRLLLSEDFYSIVVTIQKGENEMESVLINYDKKGNIIAHQVVSYDEIAEGMSQIVSRINENHITINHIFWSHIKEIRQEEYSVFIDGKIEKVNSKILSETIENYTLINSVLMDLKLAWIYLKTDLIVVQENPNNPNETIIVLPRIIDEGEHYFELNSHIFLVNNSTGSITHNYFESSKTNAWLSDAVELQEIKIDAEPYQISEIEYAFGIRVKYIGMSRANPYENEHLSLFVKSGDTLKKVLHNFDVIDYGGEWEKDCLGEFIRHEKELITSDEKTNGYFNLLVINTTTETKNFENENGECDSKEVTNTQESQLTFNGKTYTKDTVTSLPLKAYINNTTTGILTEPNGKVLYGLAKESYYIVEPFE